MVEGREWMTWEELHMQWVEPLKTGALHNLSWEVDEPRREYLDEVSLAVRHLVCHSKLEYQLALQLV